MYSSIYKAIIHKLHLQLPCVRQCEGVSCLAGSRRPSAGPSRGETGTSQTVERLETFYWAATPLAMELKHSKLNRYIFVVNI